MSTRFRVGIFKEDHLIENASALLFLSAFTLSLYYLIVHRHKRLRSGGLLKVVCGLGLLGFLDEVSFGQRVFDLTMPRYGEVSIDATHDVVELALYLGKDCGWGCLATATIALIRSRDVVVAEGRSTGATIPSSISGRRRPCPRVSGAFVWVFSLPPRDRNCDGLVGRA